MDDRELDALLNELGERRFRNVRDDFASSVRARLDRPAFARFRDWLRLPSAVGWRLAPAAFAVLIGGVAGFGAAHAQRGDVLEAFDPSGRYALVSVLEGERL